MKTENKDLWKKCSKTYSLLSFFFNKYRLPLVLCWPFSVFYRFRVDLGPFHAWGLGSWTGIDPRNFASDPWSLSFQIESPSPGTWLLISAPTYFVTTLKWRFLKEKLRASLYYPASMISALWVGGKDRWRGKGVKVRGYSWEFLGGGRGCRPVKSWPYFRPKNVIFHSRFQTSVKSILLFRPSQTWPTDKDDIYIYQENWSETDGNMCLNFCEQTFFSKWKTRKILRDTLSTA